MMLPGPVEEFERSAVPMNAEGGFDSRDCDQRNTLIFMISHTAAGFGFPFDDGHPDSGTDRHNTVSESV